MKNIDYVIKLGGSILYDFNKTKKLLNVLEKNGVLNLVFTIGSGPFGEIYKDFFINKNKLSIPFRISLINWASIQSINAGILETLNPNFMVCNSRKEIYRALRNKKKVVVDARHFLKHFENDINQKSDVRSAYICRYLHCKKIVVVTDVSGIYEHDPKILPESKLLSFINAEDLINMGRTSVDVGLAQKIIDFDLTCYVIGIDDLINNGGLNEKTLSMGTIVARKKV